MITSTRDSATTGPGTLQGASCFILSSLSFHPKLFSSFYLSLADTFSPGLANPPLAHTPMVLSALFVSKQVTIFLRSAHGGLSPLSQQALQRILLLRV